MYKKRRMPMRTMERNRRTGGSAGNRWTKKLPLQLMCCFVILCAAKGGYNLPGGKVQETVSSLVEYTKTDYSGAQVVETLSNGISNAFSVDGSPKMSWPCNETGSMTVAADTSSKIYNFSGEKELQVYASCGGTVKEILDGRIVISHGNGLETVYDGCTAVYVSPLQKVRRGEMIASIQGEGEEKPQLDFQILKQQQSVDIGEYLHEDNAD